MSRVSRVRKRYTEEIKKKDRKITMLERFIEYHWNDLSKVIITDDAILVMLENDNGTETVLEVNSIYDDVNKRWKGVRV